MSAPNREWPWWRLLATAAAGLGGFATLMTFFPVFSRTAGLLAAGLATIGAISLFLGAGKRNWWAQLCYVNAWLLLIVGASFRAFVAVASWGVALGVTILIAYVVAWGMPALTRGTLAVPSQGGGIRGRCLALALATGPSLLGIAVSLGVYGARLGMTQAVMLLTGVIGSVVSLALAQAMAHRLWPERPWASNTNFDPPMVP